MVNCSESKNNSCVNRLFSTVFKLDSNDVRQKNKLKKYRNESQKNFAVE